jgi:CheY-like chemotaxis protein
VGDLLRRVQEGVPQDQEPASDDGHGTATRFSGGVVDVSGDDSLRDGIARADRLLFQARSGGKPRILAEGQELDGPAHRVLLVEDDRVTATLIKHRLEKDGFEVLHYDDGRAAYEAVLEEGGFSLALLDVKLPGMDGFELLQRVRELPHFSDFPIIMLTSMGREADIVRGFELGANDYVLKPFSSVELVARIHRSLAGWRSTVR